MTATMINRLVVWHHRTAVVATIAADGYCTLSLSETEPDVFAMAYNLDVADGLAVAVQCEACPGVEVFTVSADCWNAAAGAREHGCGACLVFASEATLAAARKREADELEEARRVADERRAGERFCASVGFA